MSNRFMDLFSRCILFAVIYSIYHLTSPPSLPGGDSGELLAVSCSLGTAHPPGYPLYTLLTRYWVLLPFPRINASSLLAITLEYDTTVAWRVNNLCCILSSLTAILIQSACKEALPASAVMGPTISAIIFALSPLVWEYAYGAEVFALNNFLCSLVVFLTARVFKLLTVRDCNERSVYFYLIMGALASGLCLSNQHSSFLLVAPMILAVLVVTARRIMSIVFLYILSLSFTLGLLPYLYLVYASSTTQPGISFF
jgi:hypothetical protein